MKSSLKVKWKMILKNLQEKYQNQNKQKVYILSN